ncbi:hypothetical protein HPB49_020734 [Dermacentor silvarum]|uniref:Uncharacterized protein n=1 Tax=Dermacentor silvarum TaxID=543639 RepID=A0ACB8CMM6_DERSI|nr:hypothetical protein HPB49_020734 [Dermacentor silvarum]
MRHMRENPDYTEAEVLRSLARKSMGGAYGRFEPEFLNIEFGHSCRVCDWLWFDGNLSTLNSVRDSEKCSLGLQVLCEAFPEATDLEELRVCRTCRETLLRGKLPQLAR